MVFLILFLSFSLKNDAFLIGFKSFLILFSYSFYLFYSFLMHYGCIFSQTLWLFLLLMLFIKQLPVVYCFLVYHVPYILMLFLNHCHFFLLLSVSLHSSEQIFSLEQGRRIKNYCSVKVVTNIFHPIRLLVFSDSYFLLLFYPSLVW